MKYAFIFALFCCVLSIQLPRKYQEIRGYDIEGHDIKSTGNTNADELKKICADTEGCVAFTSEGVLKSATKPLVRRERGTVWLWLDVSHIGKEPEMPIWPMPKEYKRGENTVIVDPYTIRFNPNKNHPDILQAIERYKNIMFSNNIAAPARDSALSEVIIEIKDYSVPLNFGVDESYILDIPADGHPATIVAPTLFGAYHALESLSQLIRFDSARESYIIVGAPWFIKDAPQYPHRGMLIDSVRHFLPVTTVKRIIDSLTYSKFNALHWHLSDNEGMVLQSKSAPRFWDSGYSQFERYTINEMKDIVEYARLRGIRVIPEIDVPGHMKSWCLVYPEVCPAPDCLEPVDPSNPFSYELIDNFIDEVSLKKKAEGIFFDDFFHIGGDEVDTACWDKNPRIRQWMADHHMSSADTYKYMVDHVQKTVFNHNHTAVNWEEVVTHTTSPIDKRAVIHVWLMSTDVNTIVERGYNVIVSRRWYLDDLDNTWDIFYNNDITRGVSPENLHQILGGEACMWAETVDPSNWFNTVWPRAAGVGEHLWTPPEKLDADAALNRIIWFRCLLNRRGIDAAPVLNLKGRAAPLGQGGCYWQ